MASTQRMRRISKEIEDFQKDKSTNLTIVTVGDDISHLKGTFKGPSETPYESGVYTIDIQIPNGPSPSPSFYFPFSLFPIHSCPYHPLPLYPTLKITDDPRLSIPTPEDEIRYPNLPPQYIIPNRRDMPRHPQRTMVTCPHY